MAEVQAHQELDPRIRIRAPLRCDGIGRLDCAEDTQSGGRVAVRWLPLEANGDAAVKACEKLPAHPTLPKILQTGQVGGSAFVALDFPDGELLSARGEERLDNTTLLKLAAQLSDALATVHAQGVVHGELSRDSVLMVEGGKASLWDMPLVIANRLSDRRGENRLMQNLVKTAPFLSPERARGEGASQAADVYAMAAVLCVAGGAPLPTAQTTLGVVWQIARGEWSPRLPQGLPVLWKRMLEQMLSMEPSQRPSAAEVARAFAFVPGQSALPTVPEFPAMRLPPEILAVADELMRKQVEALRAVTLEMPAVSVKALALDSTFTLATPPAAVTDAPALDGLPMPAAALADTAPSGSAAVSAAGSTEETLREPVAISTHTSSATPSNSATQEQPPELDAAATTSEASRSGEEEGVFDVLSATPEVVRIPTTELKALDLPLLPPPLPQRSSNPAAVPPPLPTPAVQMTDSLALAPDLARATAELDQFETKRAARRRQQLLVVAGVVATLVGAGVTTLLLRSTPAPSVEVSVPAQPEPAAPLAEDEVLDDDLAPLTRVRSRPVRRASAPKVQTAVSAEPAVVESAPARDEVPAPPASRKPLKRPALEE